MPPPPPPPPPLYSSLQPVPPVLHPREVLPLSGGEGPHVRLLQVEDGKEGDRQGVQGVVTPICTVVTAKTGVKIF